MVSDPTEPIGAFEPWLLRLVAQAVEAGEVPEALLTELQAEIEAAMENPQEQAHAIAVRQIAELAGVDLKGAADVLATTEAQPTVTRDFIVRRIAEAWLEGEWTWGSVPPLDGILNPCQLAYRALVDAAALPRRGADTSLQS